MEKSCGALVYKKKNDEYFYLIIKQKHTNHYGFPKGHMEANETKVETAKREVLEETGINIIIDENKHHTVYYNPRPNINKEVTIFLAQAINTNYQIQIEEILEVSWLTKQQALKILTYDNDKDILMNLTK